MVGKALQKSKSTNRRQTLKPLSEIIAETERLLIRKFNLDDAEGVFYFNSLKEVVQFTGESPITNIEQAKNIIQNIWLKEYDQNGFARWAVIYKPDNKLIGFSGLKWEPEISEVDLGYRFHPSYWSKGIATESSMKVLHFGFEQLNLSRIVGLVMKQNPASAHVLKKVGMQHYKVAEWPSEPILLDWYKIEKGQWAQR